MESDHFPTNTFRPTKLTIIQENQVLENHPSSRLGHFVLCSGHDPHLRTLVHNCLVLEMTSEQSRSHSVLSQHRQQHPAPLATKLSTQGCRSILHLHLQGFKTCPQKALSLFSQPDKFTKAFHGFFSF